jgi:nucleoid-associated protein YgaU
MSEPGWTPESDGPPAEGGSAQALSDPGDATAEKTSPRDDPGGHPSGRAKRAFGWKRETRFGVAALLSFLILVAALIANKGRKGRPAPVNQIAQTEEKTPTDRDGPRSHDEAPDPAKADPSPSPAPKKPDPVLLTSGGSTDGPISPGDTAAPAPPAPVVPKAEAQPELPPDRPAPAPSPPTQAPSDLPADPAAPAGPALPEISPPPGGVEQPPRLPSVAADAGAPTLPSDPAPALPPDPAPALPPDPAVSPSLDRSPPPDAEPKMPVERPDTAPAPPAGPLPEVNPSTPTVANPPGESATTPMTGMPASSPPARAREVPNFAPSPPAADPVAPTRPDLGKGSWVALPSLAATKAADDAPAPRAESARAPVERSEARAPEPADRVEPVPHVVQRGENFWTISRLYYGSGRYYMALWKANSRLVERPEKLYVGMTIRIPPPEALDRSLIEPPRVEDKGPAKPLRKTSRPVLRGGGDRDGAVTPVRPSSERELALPVLDPMSDRGTRASRDAEAGSGPEVAYRPRRPLYKVRPFETLRSIARDTMNDSHRADEILELNRDVIDDPGHLIAGQVLELPEDARPSGRGR